MPVHVICWGVRPRQTLHLYLVERAQCMSRNCQFLPGRAIQQCYEARAPVGRGAWLYFGKWAIRLGGRHEGSRREHMLCNSACLWVMVVCRERHATLSAWTVEALWAMRMRRNEREVYTGAFSAVLISSPIGYDSEDTCMCSQHISIYPKEQI
eukprot:360454-Chlamydomonas_euryale.AAC.3